MQGTHASFRIGYVSANSRKRKAEKYLKLLLIGQVFCSRLERYINKCHLLTLDDADVISAWPQLALRLHLTSNQPWIEAQGYGEEDQVFCL